VENLIIIGAAGQGAIIAEMVMEINNLQEKWNLLGFLDDDPKKQGLKLCGFSVFGTIDDAKDYKDCYFVIPLGNTKNYYIRKKIVAKLKKNGISAERFATLIHPNSTVSKFVKIGRGTIIGAETWISNNVTIGEHVLINQNVNIAHDVIIEDFVTFGNSVCIAGYTKVGEGCYFGQNSSVREHLNIGRWAQIGMGSVVLHDVLSFNVMVGNPAKFLRKNEIEEEQEIDR